MFIRIRQKLVVEKYDNWMKAKDLFKDHQNNHYQKLSQIKFDNFLTTKIKKFKLFVIQMNEALKIEINHNRDNLRIVIKIIVFFGNQGISLR